MRLAALTAARRRTERGSIGGELLPFPRQRGRLGEETRPALQRAGVVPLEAAASGDGHGPVLAQRRATAEVATDLARSTDVADQERRYVARLRLSDTVVAGLAGTAGLAVTPQTASVWAYLAVSATFPLVWLVLLSLMRAYESRYLHVGTEEFRRVAEAGLGVALVAAAVSFVGLLDPARGYVLTVVLAATVGTLLTRVTLRRVLHRQRSSGAGWMRRVLVAGHDEEVNRVLQELARSRAHGYEVAGVCVEEPVSHVAYDVPVFRGLENIGGAASLIEADAVIVLPCPHLGSEGMRRLGWHLERTGTHLLIAPGLLDVSGARATVQPAGSVPLLHVNHPELRGFRRVGKDVLERTAAGVALLVAGPVLLALMAAIRLDSKGPAVFRQVRMGKDDRPFTIFKLRTMTVDAETRLTELGELNEADGALFKIREDPRITRVGRVLRRYSLDELPQLFNVLLGDMSLVGPRPPLPAEVEAYSSDVRRRMAVKPGLTGLWQVSGRSDLSWDEAVRLDLGYVDNWSPMLDMSIVVRTGRAVLSRSGAY